MLLAACGGGSDRPATRCVEAAEAAADVETPSGGLAVAVAARDDRFEPACIRLAEPGPLTLVVRNDGSHPHNLRIGPAMTSVDAAQVGIVEVDVERGVTTFVCTLHDGMEGELRTGD